MESQSPREQSPPETGFLFKTLEAESETYAYCVYVPPEYTPERAWPVILFLHGSGERGRDGFLQTDVGIARAIRRNRELCPAIVVMPQCRSGQWWQDEMLAMALRCVEETSREYHCDRQRVYLTGLSMGGAGAWRLGSRMPEAFAALVPICGFWSRPEVSTPPAELEAAATRLARLPIWCFHGGADPAVPVERSRELVEAVRAAGGDIQYTEVPEAGHNVWDRAYDNPGLWRWLLAQKREQRSENAP
jgi:predicted peptidase